jgi:hypothetical protein
VTASAAAPEQPAGALRRRDSAPAIRVCIRCDGSYHHVVLLPGGALALPDHSPEYVRRQMAVFEVGGYPGRCVTVLAAWRRAVMGLPVGCSLPQRLARAARDAERLRQARGARAAGGDPLALPLHVRPAFVRRLINRLLRRRADFPHGAACEVEADAHGRCQTFRLRVRGREVAEAPIASYWFQTIYRRGLAFAGGGLNLCELSPRGSWPGRPVLEFLSCVPTPASDRRPPAVAVVRLSVLREASGAFTRMGAAAWK